MTIKKQLIWTLIVLILSQVAGQFFPPFSILLGTPFLVPLIAFIICFVLGDNPRRFPFEIKSTIVISVTILSAVIDYFYAPGQHDQEGFAWVALSWSYGLFVLFYSLVGAKFYFDFSLEKLGFNSWTLLTVVEIAIFISIPLIFHSLFWKGQIV